MQFMPWGAKAGTSDDVKNTEKTFETETFICFPDKYARGRLKL